MQTCLLSLVFSKHGKLIEDIINSQHKIIQSRNDSMRRMPGNIGQVHLVSQIL
jgi:hypothetical protein